MSKRITSFLIGALAAVLLGVPAQAQLVVKKGKGSQIHTIASVKKYREHFSLSNQEKADFRGLDAQQKEQLVSQIEKMRGTREDNAKVTRQLPLNVQKFTRNILESLKDKRTVESQPTRVPFKANFETVDQYGIITAPSEGESKMYNRSGIGYYVSNNQMVAGAQEGRVEIVECPDGTVDIQDFISYAAVGTWVKGTKEGNTITIPAKQVVYFVPDYNYGFYLAKASATDGSEQEGDIVMTINGDQITFAEGENGAAALYYTDDQALSGYMDVATVWTYDASYVVPELVTPPADMEALDFKAKGTSFSSSGSAPFNTNVKVGFTGNDVYVQGLFPDFPESWIKGTVDGNLVTFKAQQFLGKYASYDVWLMGVTTVDEQNYELGDFIMSLDPESKTLISFNDALANAATDRIYYLNWFSEITIFDPSIEIPAKVGDPINELPYENSFTELEDCDVIGIIDANSDGSSWNYVTSGEFRYTYNGLNDADDWLITPAVLLQAGRKYTFSIDTRCQMASYPERIEVKMGNAPMASAMKVQVIPVTDVDWTANKTLANEEVVVEETGYYHFGIHAVSLADNYYLFADNLLIQATPEPLAPAAITDLTVTSFASSQVGAYVSFTAPAVAIDGSALTANMNINLYRDGQLINTFENVAPGAKINYVDQTEDLTLGTHNYYAVASNAYGAGQKSEVEGAVLTIVADIPAYFDLTDTSLAGTYTIIDGNGDGKMWTIDAQGAHLVYTDPADPQPNEYLITMPVKLTAGKSYGITVSARCQSSNYPERFEVLVGKQATPAALTTVAIPATDVFNTDFEDFEGQFTVNEDGNYYVAIHGISDVDTYYLHVSNIAVEKGLTAQSPKAPRLSIQPDPYGARKAVITVTAPGRNMSNQYLSENLSKLEVLRNGQIIKTFENVAPEATKVFVDVFDGMASYRAVAYDANGEIGQKSEIIREYIGLDIPAPVENVEAFEGDGEVTLTWNPVMEGLHGGIVVPNEVEYQVWTGHYESLYGLFEILVLDDMLASTYDLEATVPYDATGEQDLMNLFVLPVNEAGSPGEDYAAAATIFTGAPYELPFEEHFAPTGFNYATWFITDYSIAADYNLSTESSDEDGGSLQTLADGGDEYVKVTPGKVAISGGNPTLLVDVLGDGSNTNAAKVQIVTPDGDTKLAGTFVPGLEWQTMKVSLANFTNYNFVKPIIMSDFTEGGQILYDNVRIVDLQPYNLAVKISAPKNVLAGNNATIRVEVKNVGEQPAKDFAVKVLAGTKDLLDVKVAEPLGSFKTNVYEAELSTSIFDNADDIILTALVDYDLDLDLDDNTAQTVITVKESTAAVPENVKASRTADGVLMTWDAPSSSVEEVVEKFADVEANTCDAFGDWTCVNANGAAKGGLFQDLPLASDNQAVAFLAINPAAMGISNPAFNGPSGSLEETYLLSGYNYDGSNYVDNDDWLISPVLPGIAQEISFSVAALDVQYGPTTFEVYYSTGGKTISDFQKIGGETLSATGWNKVSYQLPEGTTYFAIRNTTNGEAALAFLLGDIQYTRGGGSVAKYNVFIDGVDDIYDDVTTTSFTFPNEVAASAKWVAVSAVFQNGAQSKPVVVNLSANQEITAIQQITGNNQPVDVYTLDGKLVRQQTTDLKGLKGAYIINNTKVIIK